MCTESSYSYTGTKGTCLASRCTVGLAQGSVTDSRTWRVNSVGALMTVLVQQPVSVAMEADSVLFQFSGGAMQLRYETRPWSSCRRLWH